MRLTEICLCLGALMFSAAALPKEPVCVDGAAYKQECSDCICQEGVLVCVRKACVPDWYHNRTGGIPAGAQCSPGSSWKDDCNWCSCSDNGLALCTLMGCVPGLQPDPDSPTCEDGSNWKIDECNSCRCISGKQVCSKRQCGNDASSAATLGIQIPAAECEGDGRWRQECNWCRCNNGRGVCTRRGCSPGLIERLAGQPDCEGQIAFKRECNTCNCVNGLSVCTKKLCSPVKTPTKGDASVIRAAVFSAPTIPEPTCTNGSRWRDECNWCTCTDLGVGICTLMGCIQGEAESNEPECEGNARWKKDCNWCNCVDGKGVCTKRACVPRRAHGNAPTIRASTPRDAMCTAGSRWRDNCNWCTCSDTGVGMCTLKMCNPGIEHIAQNEPECHGNAQWRKDCNWCNCIDGRGVCTQRACIPGNRQTPSIGGVAMRGGSHGSYASKDLEPTCTNGSRWRVDCNWCTCIGTNVGACTIKGCVLEIPRDEPECEGDSRWKKDCNWCNCVEGRGVCTIKACIPEIPVLQDVPSQPPEEASCTAGSRWKIRCNWCHCTDRGIGVCTKIGCPPGYAPSADEQQCEDGSKWKQDCNWCNCANGKQLCTQIACGVSRDLEHSCTEGESWMQDCNRCVCSNGRALCTKRACIEHAPPNVEAPCIEGESWKEDCNQCHCSNGLRVCTLKACPQIPLQSHCLLPPFNTSGFQCAAFLRKWTFDSTLNACKQIVYGGCRGTSNLFNSEAECQASCNVLTHQPHFRQASAPVEGRCLLEKDPGPCFASKPKFYFNKQTSTCESFIYGGCQGNRNRFHSFELCQQTCGGIAPLAVIHHQKQYT